MSSSVSWLRGLSRMDRKVAVPPPFMASDSATNGSVGPCKREERERVFVFVFVFVCERVERERVGTG